MITVNNGKPLISFACLVENVQYRWQFQGFYQLMALTLWPNGTMVLSSRSCLSRIPEYEFDGAFEKDSTKPWGQWAI